MKIPNHIAIIMDGNGRWAKVNGEERTFGHKNGVRSVREIVEECAKIGVSYLTLFAFSTENWERPESEVSMLMQLFLEVAKGEKDRLFENKIQFQAVGDLSKLPLEVREEITALSEKTEEGKRMTLSIALNYGGKEEIIHAVREIANKVKNNIISPEKVDEVILNNHLYTRNLPNVDLLIRTSGEQRISNFLLWKIAYTEIYFSEIFWPDFTKEDLNRAIANYQQRERRFGKTSEQLKE